MRQKPAHPVGSLGSRGILQVGASSSTRATQTSSGRQSSQYLVELRLDGLVASVSASDASGARLSGNDELLFKRILAARVLVAEGCIGVVDDTADASFCSCSLFDRRRNVPAANTSSFDDESFVDDFRYCWMICSFSGSNAMYRATAPIPKSSSNAISRRTRGLVHPEASRGCARCRVQPCLCFRSLAGCGGGSPLTLRRRLMRFWEDGVCVRTGRE